MIRLLSLCLIFCSASAFADHHKESETWISLFDGKSLDGWVKVNGEPIDRGWEVADGTIHRAAGGGDIVTTEEFKDFVLEFEWKISKAGNSGVKYRVQGSIGIEYQVLDDEKHPDRKDPTHRTASFYDLLAAPDSKPLKPVGEWNHSKIVANGPKLEHWLNGELIVSIDQSTEQWQKYFEASKYKNRKDFGVKASPILLQDHGNLVWFRELKIKRL